jgi:CheY-like chemotaxis protein
LLVEDVLVFREAVMDFYETEGHSVVGVETAEEAIELLSPGFDLIILDYMLPGMNGFQLLAAIDERRDLDAVPLVLLTGSQLNDGDLKTLGPRVCAHLRLVRKPAPSKVLRELIAPRRPPPQGVSLR